MFLEPVAPGKIISRKKANLLIGLFNSIMKVEVKRGANDQVLLGERMLIQLANDGVGDGGFPMTWEGDYDPSSTLAYNPGDIVRLLPSNSLITQGYSSPDFFGFAPATNAYPGLYVCETENTPYITGNETFQAWPQFPEGSSVYWTLLAAVPGGSWRGDYQASPTSIYVVGDMVQIQPTSSFAGGDIIPGTYICIQNDPSPADFPVHPCITTATDDPSFPGVNYWRLLSTWPSVVSSCNDDGSTSKDFADQQPDTST